VIPPELVRSRKDDVKKNELSSLLNMIPEFLFVLQVYHLAFFVHISISKTGLAYPSVTEISAPCPKLYGIRFSSRLLESST
jgi:hypothetical protein